MNPTDLAAPVAEVSLWSMFWTAHIVVKLVMVGLLAASIWCWAIIVNKALLFTRTRKAMDRFEQVFWSGPRSRSSTRRSPSRPTTAMATLFVAAMREWKRSFQHAHASFMGLQARIEKVLDVSIAARGRAARIRTCSCWRPSPRPVPLSACSARCGAS